MGDIGVTTARSYVPYYRETGQTDGRNERTIHALRRKKRARRILKSKRLTWHLLDILVFQQVVILLWYLNVFATVNQSSVVEARHLFQKTFAIPAYDNDDTSISEYGSEMSWTDMRLRRYTIYAMGARDRQEWQPEWPHGRLCAAGLNMHWQGSLGVTHRRGQWRWQSGCRPERTDW